MAKKLMFLVSLVLMLALVGNVSADLVAHYEFDTDVSDTAGHATGPFDGTPLGDADVVDGKLVLNGTGGTAAEVPPFNLNTNTATLAAWVYSDGIQNPFTGVIFCHGETTVAGLNFEWDNQLGYHWADAYWWWESGIFVPSDTWTFVAVVVEPTQATLYMYPAGSESVSTAVNVKTHSFEEFDHVTHFGAGTWSQPRKMVGMIDDVRIYNEALNAFEIHSIANVGSLVKVVESDGTLVDEEGTISDSYEVELLLPPKHSTVNININYDPTQLIVSPPTLMFTVGDQTPKTVNVQGFDDNVAEEVFHTSTITHSVDTTDPNYIGETVSDVVVTIQDNDTLGLVLDDSAGSTDVDEELETTATYTVALTSEPTSAVTVSIATDGQTAIVSGNPLIFPAVSWEDPQEVTFKAVEDTVSEGPHTSTITHTASDGGYDGVEAELIVNVTDNEPWCGDGTHDYWPADLSRDCFVNLKDFAIFAAQWMSCSHPYTVDYPECILFP